MEKEIVQEFGNFIIVRGLKEDAHAKKAQYIAQKLHKMMPKAFLKPDIQMCPMIMWEQLNAKLTKWYNYKDIPQTVVVFMNGKLLGGEADLLSHVRMHFYFYPVLNKFDIERAHGALKTLGFAREKSYMFFDIGINKRGIGRLVFEVHSDDMPEATKRFLDMCKADRKPILTERSTKSKRDKPHDDGSEGGYSEPEMTRERHELIVNETVPRPSFRNTKITRIVQDSFIQGGVINGANEFINMDSHRDFHFHNSEGVLSLNGENAYDRYSKRIHAWQFVISLKANPWMDFAYPVIGNLVSGQKVLKLMNEEPTAHESPLNYIEIQDCGLLHLSLPDEFKDEDDIAITDEVAARAKQCDIDFLNEYEKLLRKYLGTAQKKIPLLKEGDAICFYYADIKSYDASRDINYECMETVDYSTFYDDLEETDQIQQRTLLPVPDEATDVIKMVERWAQKLYELLNPRTMEAMGRTDIEKYFDMAMLESDFMVEYDSLLFAIRTPSTLTDYFKNLSPLASVVEVVSEEVELDEEESEMDQVVEEEEEVFEYENEEDEEEDNEEAEEDEEEKEESNQSGTLSHASTDDSQQFPVQSPEMPSSSSGSTSHSNSSSTNESTAEDEVPIVQAVKEALPIEEEKVDILSDKEPSFEWDEDVDYDLVFYGDGSNLHDLPDYVTPQWLLDEARSKLHLENIELVSGILDRVLELVFKKIDGYGEGETPKLEKEFSSVTLEDKVRSVLVTLPNNVLRAAAEQLSGLKTETFYVRTPSTPSSPLVSELSWGLDSGTVMQIIQNVSDQLLTGEEVDMEEMGEGEEIPYDEIENDESNESVAGEIVKFEDEPEMKRSESQPLSPAPSIASSVQSFAFGSY